MSENLEQKISELSDRLAKIEDLLNVKKTNLPALPNTNDIIKPPPINHQSITPPSPQRKDSSLSGTMGFLGVICILIAFILLIKLSLDSGWLTPLRQIMIATVVGAFLTISPQIFKLSDRPYLSLLPALGIIALHLCVYGGVFYHHLFNATTGLFSVSIISIYSLYLLKIYKEEYYVVFAIVGTYLGAITLNTAFDNLYYFSGYLITWNIVFSIFSIKMNNRFYLTLAAYFSLFFVTIASFYKQDINYVELSVLQFLQIAVYSYFIAQHSISHKTKMTKNEANLLFPVFIFFYATEFYFLDQINQHYATAFSVIFSLFIISLTFYAQNKLKEQKLESLNSIYALVAIMLYHSIFLMTLSPVFQHVFGVFMLIFIGNLSIKGQSTKEEFQGVSIISFIIFIYILFSVTFNMYQTDSVYAFNLIYGIIFLALSLISSGHNSITKRETFLLVAHSQIVLAAYRIHDFIQLTNSAILIILYAFIILGLAVKKNDRILAKSSFPVILIGFAIGLVANITSLNTLNSVIALTIMGALIYICGYLYRRIPSEA